MMGTQRVGVGVGRDHVNHFACPGKERGKVEGIWQMRGLGLHISKLDLDRRCNFFWIGHVFFLDQPWFFLGSAIKFFFDLPWIFFWIDHGIFSGSIDLRFIYIYFFIHLFLIDLFLIDLKFIYYLYLTKKMKKTF